jgi:hypothetical protein
MITVRSRQFQRAAAAQNHIMKNKAANEYPCMMLLDQPIGRILMQMSRSNPLPLPERRCTQSKCSRSCCTMMVQLSNQIAPDAAARGSRAGAWDATKCRPHHHRLAGVVGSVAKLFRPPLTKCWGVGIVLRTCCQVREQVESCMVRRPLNRGCDSPSGDAARRRVLIILA